MKNTNQALNNLQYVAAGKKRYTYHNTFYKKDSIIKNIEIIVACIIAFIAGVGMYEMFH